MLLCLHLGRIFFNAVHTKDDLLCLTEIMLNLGLVLPEGEWQKAQLAQHLLVFLFAWLFFGSHHPLVEVQQGLLGLRDPSA